MSRKSIPTFAAFRREEGAAMSSLGAGQAYLRFFDDDLEMQDYVESRMLAGLLDENNGEPDAIVVLLHGIRTFALWHHTVEEEMRLLDPKVQIQRIRYQFVDIFTFLGPVRFRQRAIDRVMHELRDIARRNPGVPLTIVAHSFGTYVTSRVLTEAPDIRLRSLLLCGSIVREDFNWAKVRTRITNGVVNDVGTDDIWPLLAKHTSVGYGPSGRFGFGSAAVVDRFFKYTHSAFFSREHIRNFWAPFLLTGQIVPSAWTLARPQPGIFESTLAWFPLKQAVVTAIAAVSVWHFLPTMAHAVSHLLDPQLILRFSRS